MADVEIKGHTIFVNGVVAEEDFIDELLPKGTLILCCSPDSTQGDACVVSGKAWNIVFHSLAEADNVWWQTMVLPHDQRGFFVPIFGDPEATKYLYFIRPSGRVA